MSLSFAVNRTCAPQLALPEFIALAVQVGVSAVEIRNDIEGREFHDGTPATEVKARLQDAGLKVASVNALQRFNEWTPTRAQEAEAEKNLRDGLRQLRPILQAHGITGYVEPLGMKGSTLKRQDMAVAAVSDIDGWDVFQLCYDTFQFFRCGDTQLVPDRIGLAHMSGIARTDLAPADLTEPDRGLIFVGDRVGNIAQLRALQAAGYRGFVSMEPFSPEVQTDPRLAEHLRASLDYVAMLLAAGAGA